MSKCITALILSLFSYQTFASKTMTDDGWKVSDEVIEYKCRYSTPWDMDSVSKQYVSLEGVVTSIKELKDEVTLKVGDHTYILPVDKCTIKV